MICASSIYTNLFLSTPSARRATYGSCSHRSSGMISIHALREEGDYFTSCLPSPQKDFYPRPPRGGRRRKALPYNFHWKISIHALREEGDQHSGTGGPSLRKFLSTPSARRATDLNFCRFCFFPISIHALREEGDIRRKDRPVRKRISIHALREEGDKRERCTKGGRS